MAFDELQTHFSTMSINELRTIASSIKLVKKKSMLSKEYSIGVKKEDIIEMLTAYYSTIGDESKATQTTEEPEYQQEMAEMLEEEIQTVAVVKAKKFLRKKGFIVMKQNCQACGDCEGDCEQTDDERDEDGEWLPQSTKSSIYTCGITGGKLDGYKGCGKKLPYHYTKAISSTFFCKSCHEKLEQKIHLWSGEDQFSWNEKEQPEAVEVKWADGQVVVLHYFSEDEIMDAPSETSDGIIYKMNITHKHCSCPHYVKQGQKKNFQCKHLKKVLVI